MIAKDAIKQIKERLGIVDLVRRYVDLKPNGPRWTAPCPFHQETKASFFVSEEKGFFYCFGCQASGDIFDFYAKINGLDFHETLVQLAAEIGIRIEFGKGVSDHGNIEQNRSQKTEMLKLHEISSSYFISCLQKAEAAECREYIEKRGLDNAIQKNFGIGFALREWNCLANTLRRGGFSLDSACDAGLLAKSSSGKIYDRFRGRLIFPIKNLSGQVIAFGGRIINDCDEAKYINSADTPIYKKGDHLFGLYQARRAIASKGFAFLTEGYMDVLTLHQFGYENAVGVLGTALTIEQIKRLSGFASQIVLLFDGDNAGRKAALRSSEMFLTRGLICKVVLMPDGEDIDSLLRSRGKEYFEILIEKARNGLDFCIETISNFAPKDAIGWARNFLNHVELPELVGSYVSALALRLHISEYELRASLDKKTNNNGLTDHTVRSNELSGLCSLANKYEEQVLICAVRYPERLADLRSIGADLVLSSNPAIEFWKSLEEYNVDEIPHYLNGQQKIFWNKHRGPFAPPLVNGDTELASLKKLLENYYSVNQKTAISTALVHSSGPNDFENDLEYLRALQQTLEKSHEQS